MSLEENIKKWVILDNNQKKLNEHIREIREKKNNLTTNITEHISSNKLNLSTVKISDGKLSFVETKQASIISYKFLEDCFNDYFNNVEKTADLLEFIKNKRTYTLTSGIKRIYNKE